MHNLKTHKNPSTASQNETGYLVQILFGPVNKMIFYKAGIFHAYMDRIRTAGDDVKIVRQTQVAHPARYFKGIILPRRTDRQKQGNDK
jgi:hypothetical protein